jgi:hypothetical protein
MKQTIGSRVVNIFGLTNITEDLRMQITDQHKSKNRKRKQRVVDATAMIPI